MGGAAPGATGWHRGDGEGGGGSGMSRPPRAGPSGGRADCRSERVALPTEIARENGTLQSAQPAPPPPVGLVAIDGDSGRRVRPAPRGCPPYYFAGQRAGRPREHWYVSDHPDPLDANAQRRSMLAAGQDPARVLAVAVTHGREGQTRTDSVQLAASPCRVYGVRLWLLCPRCGSRRRHLFHVRGGVACRVCLRIGYPARRRGRSSRDTCSYQSP